MKTYLPKVSEMVHNCVLIDAKDKILGRVAAKAATILRGKHKRTYTPFLDTGDTSGQRSVTLGNMLAKTPEKVLELAVTRMLPSGPLAYKQATKLKVYAGEVHPHAAQKPTVVVVN